MTLLERQQLFARLLPRLLDAAHADGLAVTLGEVYRPPETAQLYARQGRGSAASVHCLRLAIDLQLFRDGQYLRTAEPYAALGNLWRGLDPACAWGGHFPSVDAGHFSLTWQGRA